MPTLPTVDDLGKAPAPQSAGGVVSVNTSQVGTGLEKAGSALTDIAVRIQDRNDSTAVNDALVKFQDEQRKKLYDPNTGLMSREGTRAMGATEEAAKWHDETHSQISSSLTDRQKYAFEKISAGDRVSFLTQVGKHEEVQQDKAYTNSLLSRMKSEQVKSALNYQDKTAVDESRKAIIHSADELASYKGMDKDAADMFIKENLSKFHNDQIDLWLAKDPSTAKEYLNKHAEEVINLGQLNEKLKARDEDLRAQNLADDAMAKHGSVSAQKDLIRSQTGSDPGVRAKALQMVEHEYGFRKAQEEQYKKDVSENAFESMVRLGGFDKLSYNQKDELLKANPQAFMSLQKLSYELQTADLIKTDANVESKLRDWAGKDPADFAEHYNPVEWNGSLAKADRDKFANLQNELRANPDRGRVVISEWEKVQEAIKDIGIKFGKDASQPDKDKQIAFIRRFDAEKESYRQNHNGVSPDSQEVTKILDSMRLDVKNPFFGARVRAFEYSVPGVPDGEVSRIVSNIRAVEKQTGVPVEITPDGIQKIYLKQQEKRKALQNKLNPIPSGAVSTGNVSGPQTKPPPPKANPPSTQTIELK